MICQKEPLVPAICDHHFNDRKRHGKEGQDRPSLSRSAIDGDDLLFDIDRFAFTHTSHERSETDPPSDTAALLVSRKASSRGLRKTAKIGPYLSAALILPALAAVALFVWSPGAYSVEARLVFVNTDPKIKDSAAFAVDEELGILRCPEVALSAARELYSRSPAAPGNGGAGLVRSTAWTHAGASGSNPEFQPASEGKGLALWFMSELSVEPVDAKGSRVFRLRMNGPDVELLKSAVAVYTRRYLEYRTALESTKLAEFRQISVDRESKPTTGCHPDDQLKKLDLMERNFEQALHSMDTGKGTFRGFIPDAGMAGTSSLVRFQEKLVELEIKKRELTVQFTPTSQEIRSLDQEIKGIKGAMRECLSEYVQFVKEGKRSLAREKASHDIRKTSGTPVEKQTNKQCSWQLSNGNGWFRIRDGVYVFAGSPSVVREPLLARAGQYKQRFLAWLSGKPTKPKFDSVPDSEGAGRAGGAAAALIVPGRDDCSHRLASAASFGKNARNIQLEHTR